MEHICPECGCENQQWQEAIDEVIFDQEIEVECKECGAIVGMEVEVYIVPAGGDHKSGS